MSENSTKSGRPSPIMGRPPKLTPELSNRICQFVRLGSYIETAAAGAGVAKQSLYNWLRKANDILKERDEAEKLGKTHRVRKKEAVFINFLDALEKAAAEADLGDLATIRAASANNWQAAAWRLERKDPSRWGRRDTVKQEISGPGGAPIETHTTDVSGMTQAERDVLLKRQYERIERQRASAESGNADTGLRPASA